MVSFIVFQPEIGPLREKPYLRGFANNKGADQPAHPRRLISAFVIRCLESIISKLAIGESSILKLVSVAEESGVGNPEDRLSRVAAQL